MRYIYSVVKREVFIVEALGELFRFYYDGERPEILHITLRHGTTPLDAIRTFIEGRTGPWDEAHARFETVTETHAIYWTRHAGDQSIIIISCFRREDE